ncbi:hypothetical protein PM082_014408 [Marasmius tenuissimus]|nr:hypothetical protein PM082_014408 [Marasmius tenuissimus]
MLSTTHTVFRGLQDTLKDKILSLLTTATDPRLKEGLIAAHQKLSNYYYKFDQSFYYTWASLLDPRIGYVGLLADAGNDQDLIQYLEWAKAALEERYREKYATRRKPNEPSTPQAAQAPSQPNVNASPTKIDFTAHYRQRRDPRVLRDEVEEFFRLTVEPEPFGSAVAVERMFSGGRDTIALRHASLKPDTIRTLMPVKARLRKARKAVIEVLGDEDD